MHPTGVTSLDVIGGDLQSWDSANSGSCTDEDIGLIDTSRHLAIWRCDPRDTLDRDSRIISRQSEEIECRPSIVSYDLSDDLYICLVHQHTSPCECRCSSDGDMAIVFSSLRVFRSYETVVYLYSFPDDDIGDIDTTSIVYMTVFIDANICICDF
jgi:hypothetical protein